MRTLIALAYALAGFTTCAQAQTTCNKIGTNTYCSSPTVNSTATPIGSSIYTNRSDGTSAVSNRIGNTTYINESEARRSATVNTIGSTTYVNRQDGTSATANRIGNSTYITDNTGRTVVCNKIGESTYCN